ncbi:tripartite tricarboxylate transporter TctB family protein [Nocardiopsis sp. NPDC006198]|uniref:tripartite tricarboxylate transporter TctB family protein n=1 Tax=Nocardiopsis sp. NPDC006198 TaxID=3154472 RepID=UPI0033BF77B5
MTAVSHTEPEQAAPPAHKRDYAELGVAALLYALAAFCAYNTATMEVIGDSSPGPQVFPSIVAVMLLVSGIGVTVRVVARERRRPGLPATARTEAEPEPGEDPRVDWRTFLLVASAFVAFVLLLRPVGWILSAAALFWAVSCALGTRNHLLNASVALVFSCTVQIAFSIGLGLNLPSGVIGGLLPWIS